MAHSLAKEISAPYPEYPNYHTESIPEDGSHQMFDRDELMEIYKEWRKVFNSYDPPKFAVAEANAPVSRRGRYAKEETLGQAFSFELLETAWDAEKYREVITTSLNFAEINKSTTTWTLSNHDQVRHVSKFGLPAGTKYNDWLLSNGTKPVANYEQGVRRARAATLMILGLPGCTYLYQGEELALPEVPDLPESQLADPIWKRTSGKEKGRDGCRVSIPWSEATAHKNFKGLSAELQESASDSMLNFYRKAIDLRKELCTDEEFAFIDSPKNTIAFKRSNGWTVITNFGLSPVDLPAGQLLISSAPLESGKLPADATAWLK